LSVTQHYIQDGKKIEHPDYLGKKHGHAEQPADAERLAHPIRPRSHEQQVLHLGFARRSACGHPRHH